MTKSLSDIQRKLTRPPVLDTADLAIVVAQAQPTESKPSAGRFDVLNSFVDSSLFMCKGSEVAVWLFLFRDTRNGTARVSRSWIAQRAGINPKTVQRALRRLQGLGLVDLVRRGGPNAGVAVYKVRGKPAPRPPH